jgi:hypothetical protein
MIPRPSRPRAPISWRLSFALPTLSTNSRTRASKAGLSKRSYSKTRYTI